MPYIILFVILTIFLVYFYVLTKQEYKKLNNLRNKRVEDISDFDDFKIEISGAELKIGDTIIKPKRIIVEVKK